MVSGSACPKGELPQANAGSQRRSSDEIHQFLRGEKCVHRLNSR